MTDFFNQNDAVVNAGPAVFISTSGPNPIMVQVKDLVQMSYSPYLFIFFIFLTLLPPI